MIKYRTTTWMAVLLSANFFMSSCSNESKQTPLEGKWSLIKSEEVRSTPLIMELSKGNFKSYVTTADGNELFYNQGKYFIPEEGTVVTVHSSPSGELFNTSNYYNYEIEGDTMHFVGYFYRPTSGQRVLSGSYIDEYWVREE